MPLLSSAASTLHAFGRDLESTEHLARILRIHLELSLDGGAVPGGRFWPRFLLLAGWPAMPEATASQAVETAIAGPTGPSLRGSVDAVRLAAQAIRPRLSTEIYEQVNSLYWRTREGARDGQLQSFLHDVELTTQLIGGLVDDTMTHDHAWSFVRLGRHLTRSRNVARLVTRKAGGLIAAADTAVAWSGVLRCCSAFEAFRLATAEHVGRDAVIRFLLLHPSSPRAVHFCLEETLTAVRQIDGGRRSGADHAVGQLLALLLDGAQEPIRRPELFGFRFERLCGTVSEALDRTYFAPAAQAHRAAPAFRVQSQQQQQTAIGS
jgi:uncharacterized alpha-E superfamily protein